MVYVFMFVCICLFQGNIFAQFFFIHCFRPPKFSPPLPLNPLNIYVSVLCIGTTNELLLLLLLNTRV